ncbi:MAG: pitrilysin family protein, partial [bacterium]
MKIPSFEKIKLNSGVTLLIERIPYLSTIAIGYWMNFGSREEKDSMQGSTHFIEHMMFKGTEHRSPSNIAHEIEYAGGSINALTGKELTCCYARILPDNLPLAIDILSDIFFSSVFPEEEFLREKQVILEEIKDLQDTPEDLVYDMFHEDSFGKDGLGHSVLGSEETVNEITRDSLFRIYCDRHKPSNLIIAVAGNPEDYDLPKLISESLQTPANTESLVKNSNPKTQNPEFKTGISL